MAFVRNLDCDLQWRHLHRGNLLQRWHILALARVGCACTEAQVPPGFRNVVVLAQTAPAQPLMQRALQVGLRLSAQHKADLCSWCVTAEHFQFLRRTMSDLDILLEVHFDDDAGAKEKARAACTVDFDETTAAKFEAAIDPLTERVLGGIDDDLANEN